MHRHRLFGLVLLGLVAIGCSKDASQRQASDPQKQVAAPKQPTVSRDLRTVRLRYEGFTKSKSGAT